MPGPSRRNLGKGKMVDMNNAMGHQAAMPDGGFGGSWMAPACGGPQVRAMAPVAMQAANPVAKPGLIPRFCPNCGQEAEPNHRFCPYCCFCLQGLPTPTGVTNGPSCGGGSPAGGGNFAGGNASAPCAPPGSFAEISGDSAGQSAPNLLTYLRRFRYLEASTSDVELARALCLNFMRSGKQS
jgi:hypothetical protein